MFLLLQIHSYTWAQQKTSFSGDSLFLKYADTTLRSFTPAQTYYVVTWKTGQPKACKVVRQLDEKTAVIVIGDRTAFDSLAQQARLAVAQHPWKFSQPAEKWINTSDNHQRTWLITALDLAALRSALEKKAKAVTILSIDKPSHTALIKTTAAVIKQQLLSLQEIIFIDLRAEPQHEIAVIGYNRGFHRLNAVDFSIPGADGNNIVVGVKEQRMEPTDLDLYKRVLPSPVAATAIENHATVIASIIGGAGNSFYDGRGIAYGCNFFPSSFDNLFADDETILHFNKVSVQNHSYGTVVQQFYGAEALSYDALAWNNKIYAGVFSAGNQGGSSASEGKYAGIPGYANLTGNFKMAKNIITVGAIDNKGNIAAESSAGPLYDGRLAPQLVALGPNGTSDAAAIVSGTIAVMQQVYADSNNQFLPPASLIKSILYNTAEDIGNAGIDYKTGYGLLDSYAAIRAVQQKQYEGGTLVQGVSWTKAIFVPANTAQLKITLAWTDSAAGVNNNKALINDPDLVLTELNTGAVYHPWVLQPAAHIDSLRKLPSRGRDSLNTAEQISISLPAPGNYFVSVNGTNVSTAALPFHICWQADTLHSFQFTSPQHASDVIREEDANVFIRWKTFVADSNQTGKLFISYNRGNDWQLLQSSLPLYPNQYQWSVPDTSSTAQLKMETAFGVFFSKEFIISPVIRTAVDFRCADSIRLSWNPHIYANHYKVFALTDSPYLKHLLTVTDTFTVLKRLTYPWQVYAVEPVLNNHIPASRSIARDVSLQGVHCFYKTFYHNLLDGNKLDLVLELSMTGDYIDSVYFEQVTASGVRLRNWLGLNVGSSDHTYHGLVNETPGGTTYWRARIKLKTGAELYTDIISVLTSGKRFLLFYPNPANRDHSLVYVLQQGVPGASRLQLFDISGRMLRNFLEMPGSVDISAFPKGLIIYKLMDTGGKLMETGKLLLY